MDAFFSHLRSACSGVPRLALAADVGVGKVMSLLLNMLSRFIITFLPRSKCLLISWLQSPSVAILEPRKIKSDTVFTVSPSISHEVVGLENFMDRGAWRATVHGVTKSRTRLSD